MKNVCIALIALPFFAAIAQDAAAPTIASMTPAIHEEDIKRHIYYLASEALQGRLTGTEGEQRATEYVADAFAGLGLKPAGDADSYFQPFEFTAGVSLGEGNALRLASAAGETSFAVDEQWRPIAFSKTGEFEGPVAFAGYGIVAPALESLPEYDSYVHLDVKDKWVLVFRYVPENVSTELRLHLTRYAGLRQKAIAARDRGALGLLVVSGPNSQAREALVRLNFDASFAGSGIAAVSIGDDAAETLLKPAGKTLKALQDALDTGQPVMGFDVPDTKVHATVDVRQEKRTGRNVLARLDPPQGPTDLFVVIGAHADHLGANAATGSLARDDERAKIHYGADDNASGIAVMLEVAQWLTQGEGAAAPRRNSIVFAAWSGEELGLLGSNHYVRGLAERLNADKLSPPIVAYVNLDMVGRLRDSVIVGGVGSSSIWETEIETQNKEIALPISTQNDSYLPTDCTSFFVKGVPFLNAFTGAHDEYHTPRDVPETINCGGAAQIAKFTANILLSLANRESVPDYIGQAKPAGGGGDGALRAYLGTIPDYGRPDVVGLPLAGVADGGPAAKAGIKGGDVIVELAGRKVENIYDYTYAIEGLKLNAPVDVVVVRNGERMTLEITPIARE